MSIQRQRKILPTNLYLREDAEFHTWEGVLLKIWSMMIGRKRRSSVSPEGSRHSLVELSSLAPDPSDNASISVLSIASNQRPENSSSTTQPEEHPGVSKVNLAQPTAQAAPITPQSLPEQSLQLQGGNDLDNDGDSTGTSHRNFNDEDLKRLLAPLAWVCFFVLAGYCICAVELSISWNHFQGVNHGLTSAGQLIPFVIGAGTLLQSVWKAILRLREKLIEKAESKRKRRQAKMERQRRRFERPQDGETSSAV